MQTQPQLHKLGWYNVRSAMLRAYERAARDFAIPSDTWLVFEAIVRLCWYHAREANSHAAYAVCSETWLAERVGCRRETVSQHVWRLHNLGLLQVTNRRPRHGSWSTNLYRLCSRAVAALHALVKRTREAPPSKPKLQLSRSESLVCAPAHTPDKALESIIQRWTQRGAAAEQEDNG